MAKALRLSGVSSDELYAPKNNNNLDYYQTKFTELALNMDTIKTGSIVLIPSNQNKSHLKEFKQKSIHKLISLYSNQLIQFENSLFQINNKKSS